MTHCVAVSLKPASDQDVVERSRGKIAKPETLNYRTFCPEKAGLFCEVVFGPEESPSRRRNSGHIELTEPIIPMLWRLPVQTVLAQTLGLKSDPLEQLILRKTVLYEKNGSHEFRELTTPQDQSLLNDGWTCLGTGCEAVQALLKRTDPQKKKRIRVYSVPQASDSSRG